MPDLSRDPYFADLFAAPQMMNNINQGYMNEARLQEQLLQNESNEIKMEQMRRENEARRIMVDALKENPSDPMSAIKAATMASGDPGDVMQVQNQERMDKRFDLQAKEMQFKRLVSSGASLEAEDFYRQNLEQYYGPGSPELFRKPKNLKIDSKSGLVYDSNQLEEGQVLPRERSSGQGQQKPQIRVMYDKDGRTRVFDLKNPDDQREIEEGRWSTSAPKELTYEDLARMGMSRMMVKGMEEKGILTPDLVEMMQKIDGGATPAQTPMPSSSPSPMPTPRPTPSQGEIVGYAPDGDPIFKAPKRR